MNAPSSDTLVIIALVSLFLREMRGLRLEVRHGHRDVLRVLRMLVEVMAKSSGQRFDLEARLPERSISGDGAEGEQDETIEQLAERLQQAAGRDDVAGAAGMADELGGHGDEASRPARPPVASNSTESPTEVRPLGRKGHATPLTPVRRSR